MKKLLDMDLEIILIKEKLLGRLFLGVDSWLSLPEIG
jgi:hypothetical protein